MFKRPKPKAKEGLKEILAEDTPDDLLRFISLPVARTAVGKMIGDLFQVYDELIDWTTIEQADDLLPFAHGEKKQSHKYRVWWLSRTNTPENNQRKYYWGCWLDLRVRMAAGRQHIEEIRISESAIVVFTDREELLKEIYE